MGRNWRVLKYLTILSIFILKMVSALCSVGFKKSMVDTYKAWHHFDVTTTVNFKISKARMRNITLCKYPPWKSPKNFTWLCPFWKKSKKQNVIPKQNNFHIKLLYKTITFEVSSLKEQTTLCPRAILSSSLKTC